MPLPSSATQSSSATSPGFRPRGSASSPDLRARRETIRVLHADHTEDGAYRVVHHAPGVDAFDLARTQRDESRDLGFDVVGLDVEMHAGLVVADRLHIEVDPGLRWVLIRCVLRL